MQGARYLNTQGSENDPDHEAHVEIEKCRQKRRKVADLEELSFDHAARNGINRWRPAQVGPPSPAWTTQFPCHTLCRLMLGSEPKAWYRSSPHPPRCARHPLPQCGRGAVSHTVSEPSPALRERGDPARRAGWVRVCDGVFCLSTTVRVERLEIRVGLCTERGRRPQNEDYGGVYLGTAEQQARFGIIAAIADGVGGAKGGRVAAELAGRTFIDAYLSQPETRGVRQAGARGLEAVNRWIHAIGRNDPALQDMACTFTALVLRGRLAHIIHIGDTRLYRLRDDRVSLLTDDHTLSGAGRSHILTRAVGSAPAIQIDYSMEEVRVHDRFLLCSDGVHGVLSNRRIETELSRPTGSDETASHVVSAAIAARTGDNVTALVVDSRIWPTCN